MFRSVSQVSFISFSAADTIIYLALLHPNIAAPKGAFVAERKEIPFKGPEFAYDISALGMSVSELNDKLKAAQATGARE